MHGRPVFLSEILSVKYYFNIMHFPFIYFIFTNVQYLTKKVLSNKVVLNFCKNKKILIERQS